MVACGTWTKQMNTLRMNWPLTSLFSDSAGESHNASVYLAEGPGARGGLLAVVQSLQSPEHQALGDMSLRNGGGDKLSDGAEGRGFNYTSIHSSVHPHTHWAQGSVSLSSDSQDQVWTAKWVQLTQDLFQLSSWTYKLTPPHLLHNKSRRRKIIQNKRSSYSC